MNHLPDLIKDLALILAVAGVVSLLFKRLKQPLVLGYIVAGFLSGPHIDFVPTVRDIADVKVWADIGVIVLLFTLGLDFSFKKVVRMGGAPVVAVVVIIASMMTLGFWTGYGFGWSRMDCIYLGGMLAMSSTTIIYKAFQDLQLLPHRFTGLVLSVLILEDILAIVLMVVLSTLALKNNAVGEEMAGSLMKLVFFILVWFVVGLYMIPTFLRKIRRWINDEILLIVSLALCFGMAMLAVSSGYSAAFGAFVIGSILAETVEAEHIEKLVSPVKDLFGAIFFVSVGMLVDPQVLVDYACPIVCIVCVILLGQSLLGSMGFLAAGQSLKNALRCGFSMTQIGEFAFIIATLGVTTGVTSSFLYPIVVAVSVITTFTTPYMIRLSEPAYKCLLRILPVACVKALNRNAVSNVTSVHHESNWRRLLLAIGRLMTVYVALSVAVVVLSFQIVVPFLRSCLSPFWGDLLSALLTILFISPFLRALMIKKNHSVEFLSLWSENPYNRIPLGLLLFLRVGVAVSFVFYIVRRLVPLAEGWLLVVAAVLVTLMIFSRRLKLQSIRMEQAFKHNLHGREVAASRNKSPQPRYARHLLSRDIHLSYFDIPSASPWCGLTLSALDFRKHYGIHVVSLERGGHQINIPSGDQMLFPYDRIQVIGSDTQLVAFSRDLMHCQQVGDPEERSEMELRKVLISEQSPFVGRTILDSGIGSIYHCLVVGWEMESGALEYPDVNRVIQKGDILWVVGEREAIYRLL